MPRKCSFLKHLLHPENFMAQGGLILQNTIFCGVYNLMLVDWSVVYIRANEVKLSLSFYGDNKYRSR
jgi:hypothetical protein